MPDRRIAGTAARRTAARLRGTGVLLLSFALMATMGAAMAREWRSPWSTANERGTQTGEPTLIVVAEASSVAEPGTGVDIKMDDLLAGGSELAGVAPRPATSGIGSDVERDLFSGSVPLNAPDATPEGDGQYLLSGSY